MSTGNDDIESFKTKFIYKICREIMQHHISQELEFRWYNLRSKISQAAYAIKITENAKDLIAPPSNAEIVNELSRHFMEDI